MSLVSVFSWSSIVQNKEVMARYRTMNSQPDRCKWARDISLYLWHAYLFCLLTHILDPQLVALLALVADLIARNGLP